MKHPALALTTMLLVQMMVSLTLVSASVLAPAVAPSLGYAPERIGLYAGLGYLAAMFSGLRSGHGVAWLGAMRLTQAGLLSCAAGALLAALGPPSTLLGAAVLIGIGYGIVNPTAAAVLTQHTPERVRGLFFSIKQTGVPLGVAAAGLLMPLGLAWLGWRTTALGVALACAALAIGLAPLAAALEPPRVPRPTHGSMGQLLQVWRAPLLRSMSLASFSYALTQQVFVTFLVSMLHLGMGWSLASAAALLAATQGASALARIGFGAVADRWRIPGQVLVALGLGMSLCAVGMGLGVAAAWPAPAVVVVALVCAATAMGWNGVFFAALAQRVPRQDIARVSGATQFFTFGGGMIGPLVFGEALRAGAGYAAAWTVLALIPLAAAATLARAERRGRA